MVQIIDPHDDLLIHPVYQLFGLNSEERFIIESVCDKAFNRCMKCYKGIRDPYYRYGSINPYHIGQYLIWLYFLANTIHSTYNTVSDDFDLAQNICEKIYMTSVTISSADIYYTHIMPEIFYPGHPIGSILTGKANIGNYFMFAQGCNLGINNGIGPTIGCGVIMWGGSKIIGNCHVGNHVMFSANSYIKDMDIPDNSIVFGQYPDVVIKENREDEVMTVLSERFNLDAL